MKVLIVDDEKHVRNAIKLLVPWGDFNINTILEAPNGIKAKEIIKSENPQMIFLDIMMPVMNGIELLEWINKLYPACKAIIVSGYDDFQFMKKTIKYGGIDYILKPIDEDELQTTTQ